MTSDSVRFHQLLDDRTRQIRFCSAHQLQDGGDETQTVVRSLDAHTQGNAGILAAGEEQDRMRRLAQERSMVAAWIEPANVEIPMVVRQQQHISTAQLGLALAITIRSRGRTRRIEHFLGQADDAIRIARTVHCLKPCALVMPLIEPGFAVIPTDVQLRIFKQF